MGRLPSADDLGTDFRAELEQLLRRMAVRGLIPDQGEREIKFRLKADHRLSWYEPTSIRIPAAVLEPELDLAETA